MSKRTVCFEVPIATTPLFGHGSTELGRQLRLQPPPPDALARTVFLDIEDKKECVRALLVNLDAPPPPMPGALRVPLRSVLGRLELRKIDDCFEAAGFSERAEDDPNISGQRRARADAWLAAIDWSDGVQREGVVRLVESLVADSEGPDAELSAAVRALGADMASGGWGAGTERLEQRLQNDQGRQDPAVASATVGNSTERAGIFLVHGRNHGVKETVARFLERAVPDHRLIILHEQPNQGLTIIEKLERYSNVAFAVVLLTGDDVLAQAQVEPAEAARMERRARQNVVLELGWFAGKLGRDRVCALYEEGVVLPSDYDGVLYTPLDEAGAWRSGASLRRRSSMCDGKL